MEQIFGKQLQKPDLGFRALKQKQLEKCINRHLTVPQLEGNLFGSWVGPGMCSYHILLYIRRIIKSELKGLQTSSLAQVVV